MPRTPAKVTQADIARAVRAVAQSRVKAIVEVAPDGTIRVLIGENADSRKPEAQVAIEKDEEVVL